MNEYIGVAIQIVVGIAYLTYCLIKFGLTDTVSATYYEHKKALGKASFIVFCLAIAAPHLMFLDYADVNFTFLTFFGVCGILLVGAAPNYRDDHAEKPHVYGAILGIVLVMMGLGLGFGIWWAAIATAVISALAWLLKVKGATYISEVAAILTTIIAEIQILIQ